MLSIVLSVETARQHFSKTALITDREGADTLVGVIGLKFDEVCEDLECLDPGMSGFWNLGKVHAVEVQREPFVHVDNDLFLWDPLPERIIQNDVFAQNPEFFTNDSSWYVAREIEEALEGSENGGLPIEWVWCRRIYGEFYKSMNTGIFGGRRTDFTRYVGELCRSLVSQCVTNGIVAGSGDKGRMSGTIEMLVPSVVIDYHVRRVGSPFFGLTVGYMFGAAEDAYKNVQATRYTHILGSAKRWPQVVARLHQRVQAQYPEFYNRCIRLNNECRVHGS